jgi:hypothetical protein
MWAGGLSKQYALSNMLPGREKSPTGYICTFHPAPGGVIIG